MPARIIRLLFPVLLLFVAATVAGITIRTRAAKPSPKSPWQELFSAAPLDTQVVDRRKTSILIEKSAYRLQLWQGDSVLKSYPVVFGGDPVGDKFQEGDQRTPEGRFKIRSMYDHTSWSKFIWVDYPNEESWNRFRKRKIEGMISAAATIGGEIGIHGVPEDRDDLIEEKVNWTLGCIALRTRDILELYGAVQVGTNIEIVP